MCGDLSLPAPSSLPGGGGAFSASWEPFSPELGASEEPRGAELNFVPDIARRIHLLSKEISAISLGLSDALVLSEQA